MKKIITLLLFFTAKCFAGYTIDLTDPQYLDIADMYPSYKTMGVASFAATNDNISIFALNSNVESNDWDTVFAAKIDTSQSGQQRIYITLDMSCSDKAGTSLNTTTIKTNDQNVRYNRYCDGSNVYLTPLSTAGDNFLKKEFKKKDIVKLEFSDITVLFDATGFIKSWNSFGGDAL